MQIYYKYFTLYFNFIMSISLQKLIFQHCYVNLNNKQILLYKQQIQIYYKHYTSFFNCLMSITL